MPSPPSVTTWTTRTLLAWMTEAFTKAGLDSPRLMSEMLLSHVLGCERIRLYTDADRPASEPERGALRALVQRALKHEPVQYLVGEAWFFSLPMHVDRRVLVPRPSTETIVERVLQHARAASAFESAQIADVCTGSGAIAVALLKNLPNATAVATDISADVLAVARQNADRHAVTPRLTFALGDLLEPLRAHAPSEGFHVVASNPPYIPDAEWDDVPRNVREHEPEIALRGGADGLHFVRALLREAPDLLHSGGILLVEIAASTANQARAIAESNSALCDVQVLKDWEGLDRVVMATRR